MKKAMRYWFSRFSFSLIIIAMVLFWESHKPGCNHPALYITTGAILLGLGLAGIRERHRRDSE